MTIKNSELRIPIIINLVIVFFLYLDLLLPVKTIIKEDFSSCYSSIKNAPRIKSSGKEIRNILETKSGNLYYLSSFHDFESELKKGQKIYLSKTFFLTKTKVLKTSNNKEWNTSLLSNSLIMFLFAIATIITFLNFYFANKYLDVFLIFSSAFIYLISISYVFYFS